MLFGGIAQLVEHSVHTRSVICSSQIAATIRPVGQAVKTPPFHGDNRGSIPLRVTTKQGWSFSIPVLKIKYLETYRSGHNEHDWKSCCPQNGHVGSNPTVSAKNKTVLLGRFCFLWFWIWRRVPVGLVGDVCDRCHTADEGSNKEWQQHSEYEQIFAKCELML